MSEHVVVVGYGMVAHRLVETLAPGTPSRHDVTVIGEEPRPAYDRVALTAYLPGDGRRRSSPSPSPAPGRRRVTLRLGDRAVTVDRDRRVGHDRRRRGAATTHWSSPPVRRRSCRRCPGADSRACFVYRTIDDLDAIRAAAAAGEPAPVAAWSSAAACSGWRRPTRCAASASTPTSSRSRRG